MEFSEAKITLMPFGKYKGKTIDQIAETDSGLRYLDWLRGEMAKDPKKNKGRIILYEAMCTYLGDPAIGRELENL